jgi:hypothetical protein
VLQVEPEGHEARIEWCRGTFLRGSQRMLLHVVVACIPGSDEGGWQAVNGSLTATRDRLKGRSPSKNRTL